MKTTMRYIGMIVCMAALECVICQIPAGAESESPEKISIWNGDAPIGDGTFVKAEVTLQVFHPEKPNGAAIVICPGGGYAMRCMDHEGAMIAQWLNAHGILGAVLEYRMPHGKSFIPLNDAQRALRTVRYHAKDWNLNPGQIGILGFSAGGHLASTAITHYDAGDPAATDPVNKISCRPDYGVLIYPVITMGDKTHHGSRTNLLGENPSADMIKLFSNELQITEKTCPAFLAHALDDEAVVPENSKMFCDALTAHHVAGKYLELPSGGHGLNGYKGPSWDAWQRESLKWLAEQNLIPKSSVE